MKIGLQIPDFTWPGGPTTMARDLAQVARTADDAGFDAVAVMDHSSRSVRSGRWRTTC